jgi:hypothetical protein
VKLPIYCFEVNAMDVGVVSNAPSGRGFAAACQRASCVKTVCDNWKDCFYPNMRAAVSSLIYDKCFLALETFLISGPVEVERTLIWP